MNQSIFDGYVTDCSKTAKAIRKYRRAVPQELLDAWERYGFGTAMNGYFNLINPDEYKPLIDGSYFRAAVSVPIAATAFADLITWEENRYITMLQYKYGNSQILSAGFEFFFGDLCDSYFLNHYFELDKYQEAVNVHGTPGFDECFGYVPLLGMGGYERVENIQIVKLKAHIAHITQTMGPI